MADHQQTPTASGLPGTFLACLLADLPKIRYVCQMPSLAFPLQLGLPPELRVPQGEHRPSWEGLGRPLANLLEAEGHPLLMPRFQMLSSRGLPTPFLRLPNAHALSWGILK